MRVSAPSARSDDSSYDDSQEDVRHSRRGSALRTEALMKEKTKLEGWLLRSLDDGPPGLTFQGSIERLQSASPEEIAKERTKWMSRIQEINELIRATSVEDQTAATRRWNDNRDHGRGRSHRDERRRY